MLRMSLWGSRAYNLGTKTSCISFRESSPMLSMSSVLIFTAPVLQGAGNAGVQFFPVDAVVAVYRGVDAGFFQSDLVSGYFALRPSAWHRQRLFCLHTVRSKRRSCGRRRRTLDSPAMYRPSRLDFRSQSTTGPPRPAVSQLEGLVLRSSCSSSAGVWPG